MSLRVDDRSGRSQGRSSSGRERSRSRSAVRMPEVASSPPASANYGYAAPPAMPGSFNNGVTSPVYETRSPASTGQERPGYFASAPAPAGSYPPQPNAPGYAPPPNAPNYPPAPGTSYPQQNEAGYTMGDYKDFPLNERPGYYQSSERYSSQPQNYDNGYRDSNSPGYNRHNSYDTYPPQQSQPLRNDQPVQNQYPPQPQRQQSYPYSTTSPQNTDSRSSSYQYQYAEPPQNTYSTQAPTEPPRRQFSQSEPNYYPAQPNRTYSQGTYDPRENAVDITPYSSNATQNRYSVERKASGGVQSSATLGLTPAMGLLSVGGAQRPITAGELPPPSPLLEAYRGTYQQMSPMPLALRPDDEDDLSDLEPLSPTVSHKSSKGVKMTQETIMREKEKKKVTVYDPEKDAAKISKALKHHGKVDAEVICEILPALTHDQIMYLRKEYKKQVRVQGKGVNLSKHINTEIKGNFGKAAYVTSLGRWESEGYWANFFYQSHGSRRELLIESLMGRSNADIWNIKDEFKDKRYSDDLVKCMEKELKMDKFRTAVLLALEERRQEEQDVYPAEYRNKDIETLHKALTAPKGGESTMLEIIVLRSDAHLRDVLKTYERAYGENFPRAALKKSNNLVGEVIAHILNGVINKPARDALLLRHAIEDVAEKNKDEELRYELLVSRLVRLHWDKLHLMRVKREYETKRGQSIEEDIQTAMKGDLADFLCQLCQTK